MTRNACFTMKNFPMTKEMSARALCANVWRIMNVNLTETEVYVCDFCKGGV